MLPPGRPGGLGGGAHSVDSGLSGDHGRKSEVVSVFFGSSHDHLSIPFCSSSIMVQPKLKEKDWKRNHHFVKVRSLDVFGTFQFQYIWFVYICGFIYWPFFGPPHPPSTWRLVACCPGKPLKLRHPCNRTWEPWHFTSKKKRVDPGWDFSTTKMEGLGSLQTSKRYESERVIFFSGGVILMTLVIWVFFSQTWSLPCSCFCVFKSECGTTNLPPESNPDGRPPSFETSVMGPMTSLGAKGGRMLRPSWHVEPWEVDFDRRDRAGRGGFGEVFVGHWAGQQAAVKEAPKCLGSLGKGWRGGSNKLIFK